MAFGMTFAVAPVASAPPPSGTVTWNPADKGTSITLSGGNLIATCSAIGTYNSVRATFGRATGQWYWEYKITSLPAGNGEAIGFGDNGFNLNADLGGNAVAAGINGFINQVTGGWTKDYTGNYGAANLNDVYGIAINLLTGKAWVHRNGTYVNSGDPAAGTGDWVSGISGTIYPAVASNGNGPVYTANFGATAFSFTPPSGFLAYQQ